MLQKGSTKQLLFGDLDARKGKRGLDERRDLSLTRSTMKFYKSTEAHTGVFWPQIPPIRVQKLIKNQKSPILSRVGVICVIY